jgi:hypothetical protein
MTARMNEDLLKVGSDVMENSHSRGPAKSDVTCGKPSMEETVGHVCAYMNPNYYPPILWRFSACPTRRRRLLRL